MTDHLPTGQARELLHKLNGQRVRVEQHTLGGDLVIEVGYLHYEQETRTWGIRDAVVTYPAADVYVDPRHLINVTPEQRGVLWDYVHRAVCEAGVAEGAAEQLADRMLAALTVEDTATVERISRDYHRQPIRTREDLADVVAHVAPGVAREDDDLPTPEPLPCGATAPLHTGATATCNRPAGHDTHAADNGARWTEDPYRTGLASELRRLAKTYGYPAVAHALTEQILHTQEQK